MRIEIYGSGRSGSGINSLVSSVEKGIVLGTFVKKLSDFEIKQRNVHFAFRAAQCCAVGGAGYSRDVYDKTNYNSSSSNVRQACDSIDTRLMASDQKRSESIENVSTKFASFVRLAYASDWNCKYALDNRNSAFYEKCPWLKPPEPKKKKSLWQKFCDACKSAVKAVGNFFKKIGNAIADAVTWVVDKIKKGFQEIGKFIKEHYKAIIKYVVGAVVIAGCFVLSAVTCGAAAPIFAAAATAALTGGLTSLGVSVVTGIAEGKSFGEIFDGGADAFMTGAIAGAVSGGIGSAAGTLVGSISNEILAQGAQLVVDAGARLAGKVVADGVNYMIDHDGDLGGFLSDGDYWKENGWNFLAEVGGGALGIVQDKLVGMGEELLGEAWDAFKQTEMGQIVDDAMNYATDAYHEAKDWIDGLVGDAKDWVNSTVGEAKDWMNGVVGDAKDWVNGLVGDAKDWVNDQVGNAKDWINDQVGGAKEWLGDQLQDVQNWAQDAFGIDSLTEIVDIVQNPSEFAQHIGGNIMENIFGTRSPQDLLSNGLSQIADSMGLTDMANMITDTNFKDVVTSVLMPDLSKLPGISDISSGINSAVNTVSGIASDIQNTVSGTISNVSNTVSGIASDIQNTVSGTISNATSSISSYVTGAQNSFNTAVSNVKDTVAGYTNNIVNTAQNAWNGVCGGSFPQAVTSALDPVKDFGQQAASAAGKVVSSIKIPSVSIKF